MITFKKILLFPFRALIAKGWPVRYARSIGVNIRGRVTIYGSSLNMFSTEPYLVTLGDNVFISVGAKFVCHDGGVLIFRRAYPDLDLAAKISVGNNVFIGAGALILKGANIGDNSIVGANAVVSKPVPAGTVVAGNPARVICSIDEYLDKALARSTRLGHLKGAEKDREYVKYFSIAEPINGAEMNNHKTC